MTKRTLIIRDSHTKIVTHKEYMQIKNILKSYTVAYKHIKAIYLNKAISIDISTCYAISTKVPFYLIDEDGYILASIKRTNEKV